MSGNASRGPPDGISAAPPFAHLPPENRGFSQPLTATLARRHLSDGTLVLYDVSASHVEGRCCELARFGHPRNGRRDKMQIVFGLLCSAEGCPIAIEVFEGNTGDPRRDGTILVIRLHDESVLEHPPSLLARCDEAIE